MVYKQSEACLDVVHLLFATAALLGPERAVEAAVEGAKRSCRVPRVPAASCAPQRERRSVKGSSKLLKTLREQVSAATDVEPPDPVKLRQNQSQGHPDVGPRLHVRECLDSAADRRGLRRDVGIVGSAIWWLAVLSVLMGQLAFIPQGTSMMCAVGRPIPLRPMTILQPAVAFISFAVPGMAGRVAMESAFLYKYGIAPGVGHQRRTGLVLRVHRSGGDSGGGVPDQALTLPQSTSTSSSISSGSWLLIILVVLLAVATVVVVLRVKKIHDRVVPEIKNAWEALLEVFRSPEAGVWTAG